MRITPRHGGATQNAIFGTKLRWTMVSSNYALRLIYNPFVPEAFDFSTSDILDWELDLIHTALWREEIKIHPHAFAAAQDEDIPPVALFEAILLGKAVSKDLPDNEQSRKPGINFEYQIPDGRWIRVKVTYFDSHIVITVHTI